MQGIDSTRWRRLCGTAVCSIGLLVVSPAAAHAEPNVPVPPNELISDDGEGALSAADKDLVVKVRLAGLWEISAGEMAQQKSKDPRIREIGREIAAQHEVLDAFDRAAAKKLRISLPRTPNSDQQKWLAEMRDAEGAEFDEIYIDRLRAAHGNIFPAIGTVRATTRNDAVRKLAQQANQFVVTHMTLLESSGIVDFAALPTAPNPAAAASTAPATVANPLPAADNSPAPTTAPRRRRTCRSRCSRWPPVWAWVSSRRCVSRATAAGRTADAGEIPHPTAALPARWRPGRRRSG